MVLSAICFIRWPNCQGTMSSIQARFHFSIARASLMQELTPMWPKWSEESGTSMPTTERTAAHVLVEEGDALVGDLDAGEGVHGARPASATRLRRGARKGARARRG